MVFSEKTHEMNHLEARLILANGEWPQVLNLASIELFEDLPAEAMTAIQEAARWKRFQPGEPILQPGETAAHGVYVILEGRVETYRATADGNPVALAELGRGQWFGEFAAIDGRAGSAAVRAKEAAFLAEIPQDTFMQLLHQYLAVSLRLTEHLIRVVRSLDERVSSLQGLQDQVEQFCRGLRVSVI